MFFVCKPNQRTIDSVLQRKDSQDFTYAALGASRSMAALPPGYVVDHNRVQLGKGKAIFEIAKQAITRWQMFNLGWVSLQYPSTTSGFPPIQVDTTVGVLAHTWFWTLNPCRIVYTLDETVSGSHRFGFGYGTLPGHVELGEERFLVEKRYDDTVWYDILAYSRPHHLLAKIGYPVVRQFQKRFARDSKAAMVRACGK